VGVRVCLIAVVVAGCSFHPGSLIGDDDGVIIDAPMADARPDTPPGSICFGSESGLYVECFLNAAAVPSGAYTPPTTYNTDEAANCSRIFQQTGGPPLCVHWAGTITIGAATRVTGSRAAVFLATDSIMINQTLDASSFVGGSVGAAANTGACNGSSNGTSDGNNGASAGGGGGGGGGFGTGGGDGGSGNASGGSGGNAVALALIRGGCAGRDGGGSSSASGAAGGASGGVIYLIAKNSIEVSGSVRANGAGGEGAGNKAGGGGGGSGGLIVFDSATLSITGTVFANGGGGGEGGDTNETGNSGKNPMMWNQRAAPGTGGADNGGDGGSGSVGAMGGANGSSGGNGGGGGGGGGGLVKVYPQKAVNGMVSPPASF